MRLLGLAALAVAVLTGCQSTVNGQPKPIASIGTQPAASASHAILLAVPVELRGVDRQYACSASGLSAAPLPSPASGSASPTTVLHDLDGTDCYEVTAPLLVLQRLSSIGVVDTGSGQWAIDLSLTPDDAHSLAEVTTDRAGQQIAFVVRGTVLSAPTVAAPVTGGDMQITGNFSEDDAKRLARQITG